MAYAEPAGGAAPTRQRRRPDDDFAGWLSSYTGEPIPADEMRAWLGYAVARCAALRPRRIVDVGVGVGLFLRELAPGCESYVGIDPSESALRRAEAALAARGGMRGQLAVRQGDALALADLPDGSADLVLLNSVVQYFPSAEYLRRVLVQALRVAGPAGAVFVGDVRDLELLDAFHAHVQLERADALAPAADVAAAARRARADERELCLARELFTELGAAAPAVGEVRIELKRGLDANELTRFRYDVTLLGRERAAAPAGGDPVTRRWSELAGAPSSSPPSSSPPSSGPPSSSPPSSSAGALAALAALLRELPADRTLTVLDVPNQRLVAPLAALALVGAPPPQATAWDLQRAVWERDGGEAVEPEHLYALGEEARRRAVIAPARSGAPGCLDVVFARKEPAT
jgi:SAM-dependent methyltransferase